MAVKAKKAKIARYKDKSKLGGMVKVIFPYKKGDNYRFNSAFIPSEELNDFLKKVQIKK